ncbi:MAG: purine-nucleoside phosphorylase [Bdellovibrionales bacterium]|nr:purine-nucleoside phosphorylase [Bdellovibrionales bacterium]
MEELIKTHFEETISLIHKKFSLRPKIAITLGSGLSSFADQLVGAQFLKYNQIPHFMPTTVSGHEGQLVCGYLDEVPVYLLQGRTHYYEGHELSRVVYPTQVMAQLGVKILLLTNASGGLNPNMKPGDFMVIKDHINLVGANPLRGPNLGFLGPRFPDMSEPYQQTLRDVLKNILVELNLGFSEGVYCGVAGPSYETAAEVRFLQMIGGHAVGMSTVAENIAARHSGLLVAGLCCITNLATGLTTQLVTHEEVKENAKKAENNVAQVIKKFVFNINRLNLTQI